MNKPRVRVSIVIPAYNEERHLRACLQALSSGTVQPYEIIVVDNNSTDSTAAVARSFTGVRLVSEPRQGRNFARNTGFDAVRGDIIGRIDADIIVPKDWIAHIQQFYAAPGSERQAWSGAGFFYNVRLPRLVSFAYGLLAFRLNKLLVGHYTLWGSNMAVTKAQWQSIRDHVCHRTDIHEDLDLAMHLHHAGYGITYDTTIKTHAELRRVQRERHELWEYLQWWPRTLRLHHKKLWVVCWFFGAFLLYLATYILVCADYLGRRFKDANGVRMAVDNNK